ncbi:hypothetical protein JKP88DRAFT_197773 [Tribonema minus]|uniref:Hsp70-Hsp90 organising protein n=1 Tax=Tribonema minus TaxID=303371 RepID=A0A835ZGH8_9STRA|nr:hypothetical protein JKP88DRAFT_197773 [Tribonema minus]
MSTAEELKAKGNAAQQAGNFEEAIDFYSQAIALDGSNHIFYSNRSASYLSKGDADSALQDAEKCIEVKPDWPKAYTRKGAALHSLRRYDDAIAAYEAGAAVAPADDGIKRGLAEVQKAKASAAQPPRGMGGGMGNLFGENIFARLAGNPKFAPYLADPVFVKRIQDLQRDPSNISAMQQDPRLMEVLGFLLGIDLQAARGGGGAGASADDFDAAVEEAEAEAAAAAAAAAPPSPPKARSPPREAAKEQDEGGMEVEEEWEVVEGAVSPADKKKALECKAKGNKHYSAKEFDQALAAYQEAAALDPTNMTFVSNQAAVKFEQKEWDACDELCQKAIDVGRANRASYEDLAKAYVRRGKAAAKAGDLGRAIEHYRSAQVEHYVKETERLLKNTELEWRKAQAAAYVDPEKALAAKERGNEHFRAGNWVDAIKEYEEAVKRDPSNAVYRNNLASALVKIMDFNGAKAAVEKALELDPKYVKAWAKKGDIEFVMKEYHKALESFQKGLDLENDNSLCKAGLQKTVAKIQSTGATPDEERERRAHAMADPEIQRILSDPVVQQVLQDAQQSPHELQKALANPGMRAKIEKLIAAGILQVR